MHWEYISLSSLALSKEHKSARSGQALKSAALIVTGSLYWLHIKIGAPIICPVAPGVAENTLRLRPQAWPPIVGFMKDTTVRRNAMPIIIASMTRINSVSVQFAIPLFFIFIKMVLSSQLVSELHLQACSQAHRRILALLWN